MAHGVWMSEVIISHMIYIYLKYNQMPFIYNIVLHEKYKPKIQIQKPFRKEKYSNTSTEITNTETEYSNTLGVETFAWRNFHG